MKKPSRTQRAVLELLAQELPYPMTTTWSLKSRLCCDLAGPHGRTPVTTSTGLTRALATMVRCGWVTTYRVWVGEVYELTPAGRKVLTSGGKA